MIESEYLWKTYENVLKTTQNAVLLIPLGLLCVNMKES